jgi:hypothetical protein
MGAASSFKKSVNIYQPTGHNFPQNFTTLLFFYIPFVPLQVP